MVAILVVLTIIAFLAVDGIIQYRRARRRQTQEGAVAEAPVIPDAPADVLLAGNHAWLRMAPGGAFRIGLDSVLAGLLGRIDEVSTLPEGSRVRAGEPFLTLQVGGRRVSLTAPVSGRLQRVNPDLDREKDDLASFAYDTWVCEIQPEELALEGAVLRMGEAARSWLRRQLNEIQELLLNEGVAAASLPDGGLLRRGALREADDRVWSEFSRKFLQSS
ncbi:MAG: hypothetical protein Kow00109_08930 [Acidobacteriota bacterium]